MDSPSSSPIPVKRRKSSWEGAAILTYSEAKSASISTSKSTATSTLTSTSVVAVSTEFKTPLSSSSSLTSTSTPDQSSKSTDRVNPFEPFCLKNLKSSIFSPSIFVSTSTPVSKSCNAIGGGFNGWNVQELAELFPKQLEESPTSHTNPYPIDSSTEARAQEDITEFFSNGPIAPTPTDVARRKNYLVRSPPSTNTRRNGGVGVADSWTNTMLSFPPGKDLPPELELLLGPYFTVTCCSESVIRNEAETNGEEDGDIEYEECSQSSSISFRGVGAQMAVRRRLELSFGEVSNPPTPIRSLVPYGDPFVDNHEMLSPFQMSSPSTPTRNYAYGDIRFLDNHHELHEMVSPIRHEGMD